MLSGEGLFGMIICIIVAVAFWPALTRMDRGGVDFEPPGPAKRS